MVFVGVVVFVFDDPPAFTVVGQLINPACIQAASFRQPTTLLQHLVQIATA